MASSTILMNWIASPDTIAYPSAPIDPFRLEHEFCRKGSMLSEINSSNSRTLTHPLDPHSNFKIFWSEHTRRENPPHEFKVVIRFSGDLRLIHKAVFASPWNPAKYSQIVSGV